MLLIGNYFISLTGSSNTIHCTATGSHRSNIIKLLKFSLLKMLRFLCSDEHKSVKVTFGYITKFLILIGEYTALICEVSIKEDCRKQVYLGNDNSRLIVYWENRGWAKCS